MIAVFQFLAAASAAAVPNPDCTPTSPGEIVVCAKPKGDNPYRLPKLPEKYDARKIRAETTLAPGVNANAHVESAGMPDGEKSNRLMLTIGIPF